MIVKGILFGVLSWCLLGMSGVVRAADGGKRPPRVLPELRLSMQDAVEAAVDNNPKVRLFVERVQQARSAELTQLGALLPNVSGSLNYSNQRFFLGTIGLSPTRSPEFNLYDMRGNFTQYLFNLSLLQRWRASRAGIEVAALDAEATRRDTMATVGLLYIDALRAESTVKAREENVTLYGQILTLTSDRQGGGMATALDTVRSQGLLQNERQRRFAADSDLGRAKLNLLRAIGIPFDVQLILTDVLQPPSGESPDVEEAITIALITRAEIKAQEGRVKIARLTMDSTVSERLPSLQGKGDTGLIGNQPDATVHTWNIGAMLSIPIFDGGQREGRIRETRSQFRQEQIRMQDVKAQVMLEVQEAIVLLGSTRDQIAVAQEGMRAALKELELARDRFVMLSSSNIELTNAQASLARARENIIEAVSHYHSARINLARAQGRLDVLFQ